jgi:hypothetical protein
MKPKSAGIRAAIDAEPTLLPLCTMTSRGKFACMRSCERFSCGPFDSDCGWLRQRLGGNRVNDFLSLTKVAGRIIEGSLKEPLAFSRA